MTRFLSELLGAREPDFRLSINELERQNGEPNADIRLSSELLRNCKAKIRELGLNPSDTTPEELYHALQQRLLQDEQRLLTYLGLDGSAGSSTILAATRRLVQQFNIPRQAFALKHSVAKRLLRSTPPVRTMKYLGYRSLDSMLKHEPLPQLTAAVLLYESMQWQHNFLDQYNTLGPSSFESRQIAIYYPQSHRWQAVADDFAARYRHISYVCRELGAIVMMPMDTALPALAITSTLLLLDDVNDIRCNSTWLKLQQVQPNFGELVADIARGKTKDVTKIAGQTLSWRTLQHYFDSRPYANLPFSFEPHVQLEDLSLANAEKALAKTIPALEFWAGNSTLAYVSDGRAVSLNMLDVAIGVANDLPFEHRPVKTVREHVWRELMSRYLNPYNLERALGRLGGSPAELEPELAESTEPEMETAQI